MDKNIYLEFTAIKESGKYILAIDENNSLSIIINIDEKINEQEYKRAISYKNIEINSIKLKDINKISYQLNLSKNFEEYTFWIFQILEQNSEVSFSNILDILEKILSKEKINDYLKFRGDYGEALFLFHNRDYKKTSNYFSTFDLENSDKMIEIKTISHNCIMTVSESQVYQNVEIYYVLLNPSNSSMNIIELAKSLDDNDFKNYLIEKYENSEYENTKYDLLKPKLFNDKEKYIFKEKPENLISYTLKIKVDWN